MMRAGVAGIIVASCVAAWAQAPAAAPIPASAPNPATVPNSTSPPTTSPAPSPASAPPAAPQATAPAVSSAVAGGKLHGTAKSGNIPLPGVTVTAQNTLTGKRYSTTTDITGAWQMNIPQNGRYVIRTQFAAFAQGSQEAVLNVTSHDQLVNFELILASRQAEQDQQQQQQAQQGTREGGRAGTTGQGVRQMAGNAPENVSLESALSADTDTGAGTEGQSGAALPSIAANSDFSNESVAISGQAGQVSAYAGMNPDDRLNAGGGLQGGPGGQGNPGQSGDVAGQGGLFGGYGGGGGFGGAFGGGGFGGGGGRGGRGGGGGGGGGGGRGNFRGFNPGQPHGAIAWNNTTSYFNAQPFALSPQQEGQPVNGSNRFTLTFMSAPYIPHLTKPSGKDTVFLTLSGTRSSNPDVFNETVPTVAERAGNFTGLAPIYDPVTGTQFAGNQIPSPAPGQPCAVGQQICPQAAALLALFPLPNITPAGGLPYNYNAVTTAQSNSTNAGIRYNRSLGANATQPGGRGGGGGRRGGGTQNQGLRQSINLNYNEGHSASDNVNFVPQLGGKTASNSYSLQAGYTIGYHRFTNIFNANWNRSNSHSTNFFTNTTDNPAEDDGITVPNNVPLNYGIPSIQLSQFNGLSQQQPSFSISQTISFSEVLSWIHGKHNMRYGADYRRVHRDFLAGSNGTGSFTFTGLFTEDPAQDPTTGSALADFLLSLPQTTTLNSSLAKSYLRDNVYDAYAMDDWRVLPSLTLNYGVRYEFFAPYTEKYNRLANVATNPDGEFTTETEVTAGSSGLPNSLIYPFRTAFRPSVALAWRVPKIKSTVLRAGYGMNYSVGEYGAFANAMAHQPPFTNLQTNQEQVGDIPSSACAKTATCFTLANGFPAANALGNYALDPRYPMPYVMAWNIDLQKTLPWQIVLNVGYNGSRANHQATTIAPRPILNSPQTNPTNLNFDYYEALSFSKFNAGTVSAQKRLQHGVALGANYKWSHIIDDAGALNSGGGSSVQDWQNVLGDLGNSSIDIRQSVSGTYLYELPFGADKFWFTTGVASHILEGFSVSGSFTFATGGWLSPSYTASVTSTSCGTGGVFRPNLTGISPTAGGGSLHEWFNPTAYALPPNAGSPSYPYPCGVFGNAPRNSVEGPGTVQNNMALSKTIGMGETRTMEIRAQINNVFNTVQYSGVGTTVNSPNFGEVTSVGGMRAFTFLARFRF
jgi:hypothetical protein